MIIQTEHTKVLHGNCLDLLPTLADNSIDSIVTDPPYELGFMGKSWDSTGISFNVEVWEQCLRVLKTGGHLIAFGGSRTYHRMAVAIEDAGFQIRDQIMWVYGSGFPKSLNVSKAIDKINGTVKVIGQGKAGKTALGQSSGYNHTNNPHEFNITEPNSAEAQQWQGWGTALKPAHEPMVLARKPLVGTVASNVLEWGVGGLNIDGSRIGRAQDDVSSAGNRTATFGTQETESGGNGSGGWKQDLGGRWPANFIHDGSDEVLDLLGESARFFYCAKTNKKDRNEGLDDLEKKQQDDSRKQGNPGGDNPRNRGVNKVANHHPTVKPTDLMRYLVKLVTPPNGTVLDPFTGSGSTGKATILEGFNFVGIELTEDYFSIIEGRLRHAEQQLIEQTTTLKKEMK